MKKHVLNLFMTLLAGAALLQSGCSKDDTETKLPEPNFPMKTTLGIEVGGTCQIPIEPNQEWTVSIDQSAAGEWFWLDDDGITAYTLRGKAGQHTITVCVSNVEEYDTDRSIDVSMTMGGQTQVIATVVRGTVAREFSLYAGEQSGFGEITYEESPVNAEETTLTIPWPEESMEPENRPIKIAANFPWRLDSKPEWIAELSPSEGKAGETVEILLSGDPTAYPLEDAEGELVFCDYTNNAVKYTYALSIPGCGTKESVSLNAGTVYTFNAAGEYGKGGAGSTSWTFYGPTFQTTAAQLATDNGTVGYKLFVLEKKEVYAGAFLYSVCNWIETHENVLSGDDVLVNTEYRLTADAHPGGYNAAARTASVILLPASLAKDVTSAQDLIGQDPQTYMPTLKEEYRAYELATINQDAPISSLFSVRDLAGLENTGTIFRQLTYAEDRDLPERMASIFGTPTEQNYQMTYTSENSTATIIYDASLNNFTTRFFDENFAPIAEGALHWLSVRKNDAFTDTDGMLISAASFEILMENVSEAKTGYVVFYVDDKPQAAICCKTDTGSDSGAFQAELTSGNGTFMAITFDNYQDIGSMLSDFVGKNLESEFAEKLAGGTALYLLGDAPNATNKITTSAFDPERLQVQPYEGIDWLSVELADETTFQIKMAAPTAEESPYAMINIYDASGAAAGVIYCVPLP